MSSQSSSTLSLKETAQKVQLALLPSIQAHVCNEEFSKSDGLDFLDVKNGLMISYLIDLVIHIRDKGNGDQGTMSLNRLNEMKVALDKLRGLDKKLRYQIDKLLAANTTASEYALGGDNKASLDDPLQFRPDPKALDQHGEEDSSGDDSDDADRALHYDKVGEDASAGPKGYKDDDLEAARATLSLAKSKRGRPKEEEDDGIYRAPRTTAVPYAFDQEQKEKEKEKRTRRRMRATELAQTLRAQYGEAPEQEDIRGGSDIGKQRAAARRLAEHEAEKTKYEEDVMVRLPASRKDKKEKRRLMRQEGSNLAAIADLGNLVRETKAIGHFGNNSDDERTTKLHAGATSTRYDNGKRKREQPKAEGFSARRSKTGNARNSLQAALYSTSTKASKKKSKR